MATKFFVTRSAVKPPMNGEDAAMQHEEVGPFESADEARNIWAGRMARALLGTYSDQSWKFRGQYLGLLTAAEATPEWDRIEADGVRWTLRKIG
jgi:hypothetical protein